MKTKIRLFVVAAAFLITFGACKNDVTSTGNQQTQGKTGNPAIDALTGQIAASPKDAQLYASRGKLFYENEGYDEAIRDLTVALQIDSTNVDYHHLLSDVYLDYFQSRLALRTMERAAALYPERIPTLLKLCEVQYTLKQYKASLQTIDRILKIDPQNGDAFLMMGLNTRELNDTDRALKAFQKAIEIDPELIDAWINLGQMNAKLNKPDAERYFDSAIRIAPDNITAIHAKADFLRDKNDLNGAIALYKKLNIIDVQYDEGYLNAGLLYLDLDSIEQARKMFDLVIEVNPINIQAYCFRGIAHEKAGAFARAEKDYETALRMAPEYELASEGLARVKGKK